MKKITLLIVLLFYSTCLFSQSIEDKHGFKNLNVSPDGKFLIFSHDTQPGFYLLDINTNTTRIIEQNKFSAYRSSFSKDSRYIAYKKFVETEESRMQQPVLFDMQSGKTIELFKADRRCGTPAFDAKGNIVFSVNITLYKTNLDGVVQNTYLLQSYSNLTSVSPNGEYVVYNDAKDRLWLLNLSNSEKIKVSPDNQGFFEPLWSPQGTNFVANSMTGDLAVFNMQDGSRIDIGKGTHPVWTSDGKNIIYSRANVLENREVVSQDLYVFNLMNKTEFKLTDSGSKYDYPAINDNTLFYSSSGILQVAEIVFQNETIKLQKNQELNLILNSNIKSSNTQNIKKKDPTSAVYFDIPFVNQRYDTPDWFNGNWACGATAAIQCISYFGLVQQWPVWVSTPYPHISDYGNYICEIYTYNGYTFNIGGRDPNGTIGYGGYGYIIKNNWYNTKDYMRDYAIIHGLNSAVDWSPTRTELAVEVANEDPFVLLNSLTTSGHYISVIGYDDIDTTTVIVNDPYGNKNNGYANFYGRRAWYDWPGYNNGFENLNTVHCYIYFRGDPPADLAVQNFTVNVDTGALSQKIYVSSQIANIGDLPSMASTIEFYMSKTGEHDETAFVLDTFTLPSLQVGQTHSVQDSINLPDSLISDSYKLCVFADADTLNPEKLKDNNVMSSDFVIYGYPRLYGILPEAGAILPTARPQIRVKYQDYVTAINSDSVKLFLDNIDYTDSCVVQARRLDYTPRNDLSDGPHTLRVEVPSTIGLTTVYQWNFEIQVPSSVEDIAGNNPNEFFLIQNYPNPFNPSTVISFNLPTAGKVSLSIFDVNGNLINNLVRNEFYHRGINRVNFNAANLASGIYYYSIQFGKNSLTKKMLLLR